MNNYAIINVGTGAVENIITWGGESSWVPPDGYIAVATDEAGIGWGYSGGQFSPPEPEQPSNAELADSARLTRDSFLRNIYDPRILMAQRALRMASSPEEVAYSEGKIVELDNYAVYLQGIPEQAGFPQAIVWPVAPTK